MKRKTSILSLLIICLLFSGCGGKNDNISEEEFKNQRLFLYAKTDDGTTAIRVLNNILIETLEEDITCLEVPSRANGADVTAIGYEAFYNGTFEEIIIPDTVTYIGGYAFMDCINLTEIRMPDSITTLEDGIFLRCRNLAKVTLSPNIEVLKHRMFDSCDSLCELEIPEGVTTIEEDAFYACNNLVKVIIPESVTDIHEEAFYCCDAVVIYTPAGSYAEQWAIENNVEFVTE